MALRFEPLSAHDRSAFSSGQTELDDWFQHRAGQDQRRGIARVFVAVDDRRGIVGFYSLSSSAIALDDLPEESSRRLPRYGSIPVVLIGRLGRDLRTRGEGMGETLLGDVVLRVAGAAEFVGVYAIVVDAKDEATAAFYQRAGFRPLRDMPLRLFLPLASALASLERAKAPD